MMMILLAGFNPTVLTLSPLSHRPVFHGSMKLQFSILLLGALTGTDARAGLQRFGLRADRRGTAAQQTPGSVPPGPLRRQPAPGPVAPVSYPPINGTLGAFTATLLALSTNWLLYERIAGVVRRICSVFMGALKSTCRWAFAPTVALVTMRGIIATDDEMRLGPLGYAHAMLAPDTVNPKVLDGSSAPASMRGGGLINLKSFEKTLTRAFATPRVRAVALLIDSPGGSPTQSSLLYSRLKALRVQYPKVKLLCFVEDYAVQAASLQYNAPPQR